MHILGVTAAPITATSGKMTIKFHSDGATQKAGFKAYYNAYYCSTMRRTIASGNLSDPAIWECGLPPGANDSVEIRSGHAVVIPASAQVKHLKIDTGGSLTINDPAVLLTVGSPGDNGMILIDGSLSINNGTMYVNGNLEFGPTYDFSLAGALHVTGYLRF